MAENDTKVSSVRKEMKKSSNEEWRIKIRYQISRVGLRFQILESGIGIPVGIPIGIPPRA